MVSLFSLVLSLQSVALASEPAKPVVSAVLAPIDARAQYAEWAAKDPAARGKSLPCVTQIKDHVLLCFRVLEDGKRRFVHSGDLISWRSNAAKLASELPTADLPSPKLRTVDGMRSTYTEILDGNGRESLYLFDLMRLPVKGRTTLVAVPADGVLWTWKGGDAEFDHVMAVAVKEAFEAGVGGVSPVVFIVEEGELRPFAEAKRPEENKSKTPDL